MQLEHKTIVVTGAAQGIGRAMAIAFASAGSNVALIDRTIELSADTAARCKDLGATAHAFAADVADETAVETAMDQIVGKFGRLDGLINNAGIIRDALLLKIHNGAVVGRMSLPQFRAVIDVNLMGVFLCARAAAERMINLRNGGAIVNISSISRDGNLGQTNYSAAKAGVAAMTVVWSKELARHGIRCGSIAPGFVRTKLLDALRPEIIAKVTGPVPLGRLGDPAEIAHAARFIFENDFFTGRCIDLDGGLRF